MWLLLKFAPQIPTGGVEKRERQFLLHDITVSAPQLFLTIHLNSIHHIAFQIHTNWMLIFSQISLLAHLAATIKLSFIWLLKSPKLSLELLEIDLITIESSIIYFCQKERSQKNNLYMLNSEALFVLFVLFIFLVLFFMSVFFSHYR